MDKSIPRITIGHIVYWCQNKIHRTDGPAMIDRRTGATGYWVNDRYMATQEEFQEHAKLTDEEIIIIKLKYGSIGERN